MSGKATSAPSVNSMDHKTVINGIASPVDISSARSLIISGGLFTSSSPYTQAEWLLGMLAGNAATASTSAATPVGSPTSSSSGSLVNGYNMPQCRAVLSDGTCKPVNPTDVRNALLASSERRLPPVAMEYAAYHVVIFLDIDSSMFRVSKEGNIPLDNVVEVMEASLRELSSRGKALNITVQASVCLQYRERGIMKTIFDGQVTPPEFDESQISRIKKSVLRVVYNSRAGSSGGLFSSAECGSLEFVIEYSKPHFDLIVTSACPAILLISGASNKTVCATQALKALVVDRIALVISVIETSSCYIADEASLRLVSEQSGGAYMHSEKGAQCIVDSLLRRQVVQSREKSFEVCAHNLSSRQLLSYKLDSNAAAHMLAERWADGFVVSHASRSEESQSLGRDAGKRSPKSSQIVVSLWLPYSKMTYIAYNLTLTTTHSSSDSKSILSRSQGKRSGNGSGKSNGAAPSKLITTTLNVEIVSLSPSDWSINAANAIYDKHLDFAGLLMDRDFAHLETLLRIQGICDQQPKVLDGRHLSNSDLKSLAFRRVDSGDKLSERQDINDGSLQVPFLLSSIAALARQNVLFIEYLYIRNQAILANLNLSGRFRYAAVSLILKSLGITCETFEISNALWLVVPRHPSESLVQVGSPSSEAYVLSLKHLNGVFLQVKLSQIHCQLNSSRGSNIKKDVIIAAVQEALQTLHMDANVLNRNLLQLYVSDIANDNISRLVIMGKVSGFLSEYSLDLSDNFTLGSLVSELSSAKTNAGFQMASHIGGQMVDVNMCATFPLKVGNRQKDALLQCTVKANSSGVSIIYYWETDLQRAWRGTHNSSEDNSRANIMTLIEELRKQDEAVITLYSALITSLMNCPSSEEKSAPASESFSLDPIKWDSLRSHSSLWCVDLPGFGISDPQVSQEVNGKLLDLLAETLVHRDRFQRVDVVGLSNRLNLICHRVDHEHILFVEFSNEEMSPGTIDLALGKSDSKVVFSSRFDACLKARFRLFQVPVLRTFVDQSLYAVCTSFGLVCVDPNATNQLQNPESFADASDTPKAERTNLPFNVAKRVKLLAELRNMMLKRHIFNYAHLMYDNIVARSLSPKPSEMSLAIGYSKSMSHELDISTLCRARRNTSSLHYDSVIDSLIHSFDSTIGRFLIPVPQVDYFAYHSDALDGGGNVPVFVKFSYVLISSQSSAPISMDTASLLRKKEAPESSVDAKDDSSVCLLDTPELESSAAELSVARSIFKLIQGEFREGASSFDSSTDILIRVEFFFPMDKKSQGKFEPTLNSYSVPLEVFTGVVQKLISELDVFVALDILNSLAIGRKATTETIILAQRCLSSVPFVVRETMSMDVLAPISLRTQSSLPETALNHIMKVFESEISVLLNASKIGDMFFLRRWDFDAANSYSAQLGVSGSSSAWILISLTSSDTLTRPGVIDGVPIVKLEFSVTLRLLGQHRDVVESMQQKAIAQLVKYLEAINKSINQWVLLYDLFHTHMASAYLISTVRSEKLDASSSTSAGTSLASRSGIPPPRARARPPVPTTDSIALKLAAAKKEKEGDEKDNSTDAAPAGEGSKKMIVAESSQFQPGCFQCVVRGTVSCKVYFANNLNLEMAIRHLEKMAFDPFVIMNAAHQYVYRNQKGEVYYMSFQPVKKDDTTISLDIYGCAPVSNEMLEQLRKLLESKLAEYTAGLISEEIAATASSSSRVALKSGDIRFLQSAGQSRSLAVKVELPPYVSDPVFFLSLVRQLIVSTPLFLNCAEIKDSSSEFCRDLSTAIHPSCFGYRFLKRESGTTVAPDSVFMGARSRSESVDPSDYPNMSSGSFQFRKLEKISSGVGDRPLLQRKTRVEAEINDTYVVNPVFFQRKRAEQTPRCETRFNESVTLWRPEDFRFVYNNSAITGRGARGEAKQFGVGLALIELHLSDREVDRDGPQTSIIDELMNVGVKSVLFNDVATLHQTLKEAKNPGLLYLDELAPAEPTALSIRTPHSLHHDKRLNLPSTIAPNSPRESVPLQQPIVPTLRLPNAATLRIDTQAPVATTATACDSPMLASLEKKKFEVKLAITPSSDMNTSALMKHCRKCLDDALVLYIGERLLACGQLEAPNDIKAMAPSSIHPDFKKYEDVLRCVHDVLYRYPVGGDAITSSFGCFRKVTALSRNSAMKLQEMIVDMVLTEFPHLKDMKWNFNISPILSRYVPTEGRFQSGLEPKWACIKRRGFLELFSSMVMGNLFPVYNPDKPSSKVASSLPATTPKTPGPLSTYPSGAKSAANSQPNTPSLKLPQQKFAAALLNKLGPQAVSSQSTTDAVSSYTVPLQLLNDDELISSTPQSDACAPLWLRYRRSMIEISISAEGFYLFYFNINPKFITKVQSAVSGFLSSISDRVEARGQEKLLKLGIADAYIRKEYLVQETPNSTIVPVQSSSSKDVTLAVLMKFKEIMDSFNHFSWAKSIVRKLFIPIPETNGLLMNRLKSSKDIWSHPSLWTCGFLDFCLEFPLPLRDTSVDGRVSQGSFEDYCASIDAFIRNNKDSSYDVAGSVSTGAIFILSILPSSYSTSEQIVSITEVRKMPNDVVSIIHRLCNTESILLEAFKYSIEAVLSDLGSRMGTAEVLAGMTRQGILAAPEFSFLRSKSSTILPTAILSSRDHRSIKQLHKALFFEVAGSMYRINQHPSEQARRMAAESDDRLLHVMRVTKQLLNRASSSAEILIPIETVITPDQSRILGGGDVRSKFPALIHAVLHHLRVGCNDLCMDEVHRAHVVNYRVTPSRSRVSHHALPSQIDSRVTVNISNSEVDAGAEIMSEIVGNALLYTDPSSSLFRVDVLLFDIVNITSRSDEGTNDAMEYNDRTMELNKNTDDSKCLYYSIANHVISSLQNACALMLTKLMWMQLCGIILPQSVRSLLNFVEPNYLFSQSYIQQLYFLDHLADGLSFLASPSNLALLTNVLQASFDNRCIMYSTKGAASHDILVPLIRTPASAASSGHHLAALMIEIGSDASTCAILLAEFTPCDEDTPDDGNSRIVESFVSKVVDIILGVLVVASPPSLQISKPDNKIASANNE